MPGGRARIKICGITTQAALAAAANADWVGFVFAPASPRALTPADAAGLSAGGPAGPARVGLFVDPSDEDIAAALSALRLDAIQLHAPPGRAASVRARFGIPVWQALGVGAVADLPTTPADAYLLDAVPPKGAAAPGGNARPFDWTILRGWSAPAPWLLAGGLTPDNVGAAIAATGAPAVDVSSGVESARGVKDPARIEAFIKAVQRHFAS